MVEPNKKFYNRWADIFISKLKKDGSEAANSWAYRTFSKEQLETLVPIIQNKRNKK